MQPSECGLLSDFVKGLTSPTRLRILCALRGGAKRVTDIVMETGGKQANISIQLGIMRQKGILAARREEGNVFYSIADHRVLEALELLLAVAKGTRTRETRV